MSGVLYQCHNVQVSLPYGEFAEVLVGPCQHGMARPHVADEGTASDMEGTCEYIE